MKEKESRNELVSVLVITYNSEKTILETLDSVYSQDYLNLELIIADDGSIDNTINICNTWIVSHKDRFVKYIIINSRSNTGTCSNLNRGVRVSSGVFVKIIAGDDLLMPNCIKTLVEKIGENDMIFSGLVQFNEKGVVDVVENIDYFKAICSLDSSKRLKLYCRTMWFMNPPSQMYRRNIFDAIDYYDESSKIIEDVPFWVSFLSSDLKVIYIENKTVKYRLAGVSHTPQKIVRMQRLLSDTFFKYCRPHLSMYNPIDMMVIIDAEIWRFLAKLGFPFLLRLYGSRYNFEKKILKLLINKIYSL